MTTVPILIFVGINLNLISTGNFDLPVKTAYERRRERERERACEKLSVAEKSRITLIIYFTI